MRGGHNRRSGAFSGGEDDHRHCEADIRHWCGTEDESRGDRNGRVLERFLAAACGDNDLRDTYPRVGGLLVAFDLVGSSTANDLTFLGARGSREGDGRRRTIKHGAKMQFFHFTLPFLGFP